jgi:hypothetical protein
MQRDGIDPQPMQAKQAIGKRSWWFRQLVAAAPLSTYGEPPAELLKRKVEGCEPALLQGALADAAVRERSADWARALLQVNPSAGNRPAELIRLLPATEWAAMILALQSSGADLAELVGGLPVPWPAELGAAILDQLAKANSDRRWARLASIASQAVPPEVLNHPITRQPTGEDDTWRLRLVETLIFRREMYEELS